jgi:hypothetical protein
VGQARRFDGVDDWIDPGISPTWYAANMNHATLSVWARPNAASLLTGPWLPVPGYADILGSGQTVIFTNDAPPAAIYRDCTWLE